MKISPSILNADWSILGKTITLLDRLGVDWIHFDVADGNFVPNITFGPHLIKSLRKLTNKTFDVHLMIEKPERYIKAFIEAGANIITIHYESTNAVYRTLNQIKENNISTGLALNPQTPINVIENLKDVIDYILIMSVEPGFGGQKFIKNSINKVHKVSKKYPQIPIIVDGGINIKIAKMLKQAGADIVVVGSYLFKGKLKEKIAYIKKI